MLLNGASGGVGTFAVKLAKSYGAEVTAVCSARNQDMVRSLGADHLIDYTKEDFTQSRQRFDVILDNVLNHPPKATARVLAPNGMLIPNSIGYTGGLFAGLPRMARAVLMGRLGSATVKLVSPTVNRENLDALLRLLESGEVKLVIGKTYPLDEAAAYEQLLAEFGVTHTELADRIGRSRPVVTNTIRLLKLPVPVQRRVAAGVLSAGASVSTNGNFSAGCPVTHAETAVRFASSRTPSAVAMRASRRRWRYARLWSRWSSRPSVLA